MEKAEGAEKAEGSEEISLTETVDSSRLQGVQSD
jgi:hypothetical protein